MVFRPVIHLIVLVVIALVAATFVFLSASVTAHEPDGRH